MLSESDVFVPFHGCNEPAVQFKSGKMTNSHLRLEGCIEINFKFSFCIWRLYSSHKIKQLYSGMIFIIGTNFRCVTLHSETEPNLCVSFTCILCFLGRVGTRYLSG